MPVEAYLNAIVGGVLTGLVYGLSALGLSVIFGVIRIVNFAHGELMVLGMYLALVLFRRLGLEPLESVPVVAVILFCFGYALQAGIVNRLMHVPEHMQFLLLAAVGMVITSATLMVFGPDAQNVFVSYAFDSFALPGGLLIDKVRLYAGVASVILAVALLLFFRYTRTGKSIRACADNNLGARIIGLNVRRLFALTFGIGAACIGAAGSIILMLVDVHPYLASEYTLVAFVIVIIGGLGSPLGALLGGLLVGVSEALAGLLVEPSLKTMFSFGLLILTLLVRPQGLLGDRA